ncbi:hypothetical protein Trydic_g19247 [Trypoxylus dichotomus]
MCLDFSDAAANLLFQDLDGRRFVAISFCPQNPAERNPQALNHTISARSLQTLQPQGHANYSIPTVTIGDIWWLKTEIGSGSTVLHYGDFTADLQIKRYYDKLNLEDLYTTPIN